MQHFVTLFFPSHLALWLKGTSRLTREVNISAVCPPLWVTGFHPAPGLGCKDPLGIEQQSV